LKLKFENQNESHFSLFQFKLGHKNVLESLMTSFIEEITFDIKFFAGWRRWKLIFEV